VKIAGVQQQPSGPADDSPAAFFRNTATPQAATPIDVGGVAALQAAMAERPAFEPIDVYVGRAPGWTGGVAGPAVADNAAEDKPAKGRARRAKAEKPAPKAVAAKAVAKAKPEKPALAAKAEPAKKAVHAAAARPRKSKTE
jgi:hypothetical protein